MTENTTLTYLRMSSCGIDADGMTMLASGLTNKPLQKLILGNNSFGSKGVECLGKWYNTSGRGNPTPHTK